MKYAAAATVLGMLLCIVWWIVDSHDRAVDLEQKSLLALGAPVPGPLAVQQPVDYAARAVCFFGFAILAALCALIGELRGLRRAITATQAAKTTGPAAKPAIPSGPPIRSTTQLLEKSRPSGDG